MVASSSIVKLTARTALKDKWLKSAAIICTYLFSAFSVGFVASILSLFVGTNVVASVVGLLALFFNLPLSLGLIRYFWLLLLGKEQNLSSLFYYFTSKALYKKAIGFTLLFWIRTLLYLYLFSIPSFIVMTLSNPAYYAELNATMPLWASSVSAVVAIFGIIAVVATFFTMAKFYIAPMLFVANDNLKVTEIFNLSKKVTKGNVIDFVYLIFSFFGWLVSNVLIAPLIFTGPYITCGYLVHCRFVIAQYNKSLDTAKTNSINYYDAG